MIRWLASVLAFAVVTMASACGSSHATTGTLVGPVGPPVAVGADQVQVLRGSEATFAVIRDAILGARLSVEVEMYELGRDDIIAALIETHRRGIPVTVIDDPSVDVTVQSAVRLRDAGVAVDDYPVHSGMIDHVKLLVVDHLTAIMGGINWGALSSRNHDFDVALRGPVVANIDRIYAADLVATGQTVRVPDGVVDPAITVATTLPTSGIRPLVLDAIAKSTHSLDLDLYVITDSGVMRAIALAAQRGVTVQVLLDPSQRPNIASMAILAAAGVPAHWYHGGGEKLHAKVLVADQSTVVFGSANWSLAGFHHNHELDIEIPNRPDIAAQFLSPMMADWYASDTGDRPASS